MRSGHITRHWQPILFAQASCCAQDAWADREHEHQEQLLRQRGDGEQESRLESRSDPWLTFFAIREQASANVFEYIEVDCNRRGLHSTLGYSSPHEFGLSPAV
jgi:hypothetical protein